MSKPYTPHDYQKRGIKFLINQACAGLFLDPGLGKTSMSFAAFKVLRAKNYVNRMLVIAPLRPCYSVWPQEAEKWKEFSDLKVAVLHGPHKLERLKDPTVDVHVINPEGLEWLFKTASRASPTDEWPWGMLVVDECFPAGTLVRTEFGEIPIEAVKPGNLVFTSQGLQPVLECGTRVVGSLVALKLSNGASLECTPEHPVFTDLGWMPAHLTTGRVVYDQRGLSGLYDQVPSALRDDEAGWQAEMLLSVLRAEDDVGLSPYGPKIRNLRKDPLSQQRQAELEQGSPLVEGPQRKNLKAGQGSGPLIQCSRWERYRDDPVREPRGRRLAERVGVELRNHVGAEALWLSNLLQAGLRPANEEDRSGGGRSEPPTDSQTTTRSQEGAGTGSLRVESVEDLQREGTIVFNLRIAGRPHFFAGGVLVHNCTRFKHTRTKRFKTLKPWLKMFRRRYILTGTPAPNGLLDLFGQVFLLDGGHALGQFITHYKATYFDNPDKQGWTWVPRHGAQQEIYKKLEPLVMRMSAEDYLKMPSLLTNEIVVELPPAARRVYTQMENLMVAQIGAKTITAANAAAVAGKCRQVAGGGVYSGVEGRVWEPIHEAKVDALEELVEELQGQPLLVAYEFDHERERLQTRFPGTPYIGGGVSANDFRKIEQAWNREELPLLFAQPQSVAHGLNLQSGGHHVAFFTTTWNLEDHDQFIRRVYRQGQDKPVTVHYINAKDTIDEMVVKLLAKKDRTQKALLNALKIYTEERRS